VTTARPPARDRPAATSRAAQGHDANDRRTGGVSLTSASFVVASRDDLRVSEQTRQRVLRAAGDLGLQSNVVAQSLHCRVTQTIGLLSDTVTIEPFVGDLIRGISLTIAVRHDRLRVIAESESDRAVETRLTKDLLGRQVDGIIYATASSQRVRVCGPAAASGSPRRRLRHRRVAAVGVRRPAPDGLASRTPWPRRAPAVWPVS
jgi:hypothetical protein